MAIVINGSGTITGLSVGGLPDGIVDTDMLANSAVTSAKSSGLVGLSHASVWRMTSDKTGATSYDPLTDWEIIDTTGEVGIGSALTESSGVFTFPATGIWQIYASLMMSKNNATWRYVGAFISHTRDATAGSPTWTDYTVGYQGGAAGGGQTYGCVTTETILDITDVSEQKVRFRAQADTTHPTIYGNSSVTKSYVRFLKLGDT